MDDDSVARLAVPVGADDHVRGGAHARVTLLEYGDFECPYCREAEPIARALQKRFGDKLRFVFRSYPLDQHRHALPAAEAAEFAADHGKFWEYHDALYASDDLSRAGLLRDAKSVGLDADALAKALDAGTYRAVIEDVKEAGSESGIPGTPAFFLDGVLFEDDPTEAALADAITYQLEHLRA